jgi:hypothetical protein
MEKQYLFSTYFGTSAVNYYELLKFKDDDLVKSPKSLFSVISTKAGIQYFHRVTKNLDPVFQRGDDFLRDRQRLI